MDRLGRKRRQHRAGVARVQRRVADLDWLGHGSFPSRFHAVSSCVRPSRTRPLPVMASSAWKGLYNSTV